MTGTIRLGKGVRREAEPGHHPCGLSVSLNRTEEGRELVADEFRATAGEHGRAIGEARPVLLAAVGGEPSDEAAIWRHDAAD